MGPVFKVPYRNQRCHCYLGHESNRLSVFNIGVDLDTIRLSKNGCQGAIIPPPEVTNYCCRGKKYNSSIVLT